MRRALIYSTIQLAPTTNSGNQLLATDLIEIPRRGEVWLVALGAARAGEPGKTRPAVVVSADELITGAAEELVVVVPLSSSSAPSGLRIEVPPEAGLHTPSLAICRAIRAITATRFVRKLGQLDTETIQRLNGALALILHLDQAPPPR